MHAFRTLSIYLGLAMAAVCLVFSPGQAQGPSPWGQWKLLAVYDTDLAAGVIARVRFDVAGRLHGRGGCNRFSGTYATDANTLTIETMASTRMACADVAAMEVEGQFFKAMNAARSFRQVHTDLYLFDDAGNEIARFRQMDAD